jgi:transporter family protein
MTVMVLEGFKSKWFWYSVLCDLCWGGWAIFAKLGSNQIPPEASQFLFAWGAFPVAFVLLAGRRFKLEKNGKGVFYSLANGVLSGLGSWALFAAYRTGGNTSVITAVTAMYPLISVILAMLVLRERLTKQHIVGLGFAAVAFVIFSV